MNKKKFEQYLEEEDTTINENKKNLEKVIEVLNANDVRFDIEHNPQTKMKEIVAYSKSVDPNIAWYLYPTAIYMS